jgi:YHS domain-containing protein/thioredoxin-related protein
MLRRSLVTLCFTALLSAATGRAQDCTVAWQEDLEAAKQMAAAQNKILLVHFWGKFCRPCLNLDHFVFTNSMVGSAIEQHYVAVKVDVEQHPELARQYGIRTIPQDLLLTPEGNLIAQRASPSSSDGYLQMITSVAESYRRTHPGTIQASSQLAARIPLGSQEKAYIPAGQESISREPLTFINTLGSGQNSAVANPAWTEPSLPSDPANFANPASHLEPTTFQSRNDTAMHPLTGDLIPTSQPRFPKALPAPLAFDGCCPVTLYQTRQSQKGSPRWGCVHRGKLYFFASREAFDRFNLTPDVFSPMLAGNDPVSYATLGRLVPGLLNLHVFHVTDTHNVLLLFSTEENRDAFLLDPDRYIAEAVAATQAADAPTIMR